MSTMRVTILGCGSSGGIPRLGGHWGDCDPSEPRNRRRRCSLLVERIGENGTTSILIDTSPDLRAQLLDAGIGRLDGVFYTHAHADHLHGIDDLRMIVFNMRKRLPVWADRSTSDALIARFGYAFFQPEGSPYPPILDLQPMDGPIDVVGAGGLLTISPFVVAHGRINALGFRIGGLAYVPDVSAIPKVSWPFLEALDLWIVDALRRAPHPTHTHLAQTLDWIARVRPQHAILTNLHLDMDYATVLAETPAYVEPAYDGMRVNMALR